MEGVAKSKDSPLERDPSATWKYFCQKILKFIFLFCGGRETLFHLDLKKIPFASGRMGHGMPLLEPEPWIQKLL